MKHIRRIAASMLRRILCLIGMHELEPQKDPFGFGDTVQGCKHCDYVDIEVEYHDIW